jgi:DNA-binding HxlR family transcriptional regulator
MIRQKIGRYSRAVLLSYIAKRRSVHFNTAARELGLHPSFLASALETFIEEGLVERQVIDGNQTRNTKYLTTPAGDSAALEALAFLDRKGVQHA